MALFCLTCIRQKYFCLSPRISAYLESGELLLIVDRKQLVNKSSENNGKANTENGIGRARKVEQIVWEPGWAIRCGTGSRKAFFVGENNLKNRTFIIVLHGAGMNGSFPRKNLYRHLMSKTPKSSTPAPRLLCFAGLWGITELPQYKNMSRIDTMKFAKKAGFEGVMVGA
ncbi:hypothetical protein QQ056_17035 [Oscillatoria laete-virens NRMC-F 0139]|nr:hypothetical protein [Oscillatoria laete-virens]MDL5055238.1 hypothetical protein [Oscillatoria laete-virens NRMC-F 0139]